MPRVLALLTPIRPGSNPNPASLYPGGEPPRSGLMRFDTAHDWRTIAREPPYLSVTHPWHLGDLLAAWRRAGGRTSFRRAMGLTPPCRN